MRDSDSHGWVQAYFPGHGWMDFEPTAKWPVSGRGSLEGPADGDNLNLPDIRGLPVPGAGIRHVEHRMSRG